MRIKLTELNGPGMAIIAMDETPLPGDEIKLGREADAPVVRAVRRRYVIGEESTLHTVEIFFRGVSP